jgi:hypothetical protein
VKIIAASASCKQDPDAYRDTSTSNRPNHNKIQLWNAAARFQVWNVECVHK